MATVRIPSLLQALTGGQAAVEVRGQTLREVLGDLASRYPDVRDRILEGGQIRQDLMIAVDADEVRDLDVAVPEGAEVHILPAIAGGSGARDAA